MALLLPASCPVLPATWGEPPGAGEGLPCWPDGEPGEGEEELLELLELLEPGELELLTDGSPGEEGVPDDVLGSPGEELDELEVLGMLGADDEEELDALGMLGMEDDEDELGALWQPTRTTADTAISIGVNCLYLVFDLSSVAILGFLLRLA